MYERTQSDPESHSDEHKQRVAREQEEYRRKCAAPMREEAAGEAAMRDAKVPYPYTEAQLAEYIRSLVDRQHDYGTCVYAMSMAAVAAFNYVAHKLGVTGFQASCADLDLPGRLQKALKEWTPWLAEQASKNLAGSPVAHPKVLAHWRALARSRGEQ